MIEEAKMEEGFMKVLIFVGALAMSWSVFAQEPSAGSQSTATPVPATSSVTPSMDAATASNVDRDPASVNIPAKKKNFPGGDDEEDLRVQSQLPEAAMTLYPRAMEREIYRKIYKQELKEQRQDEEEP